MSDFYGDLAALCRQLDEKGLLPDPAYQQTLVFGFVDLDAQGRLIGVSPLPVADRYLTRVPIIPDRTSRPVAAFLTGSLDYWLGKKKTVMEALHAEVLKGAESPEAAALLAFLRSAPVQPEIDPKGQWVVRVNGSSVHDNPAFLEAWDRYFTPPPVKNPKVRISPGHPYIRLGTAVSDISETNALRRYANSDGHLAVFDPAEVGRALNWLAARDSTWRHQDNMVVAWFSDALEIDPTPYIFPHPMHHGDLPAPDQDGDLHVAVITIRPPANMGLRFYWRGEARKAMGVMSGLYAQMRDMSPFLAHTLPKWPKPFEETPRYGDMISTVLQALLRGDNLPAGVIQELVRLFARADGKNEALIAGMIEFWATKKGLI